jgi:hypothetical protein
MMTMSILVQTGCRRRHGKREFDGFRPLVSIAMVVEAGGMPL